MANSLKSNIDVTKKEFSIIGDIIENNAGNYTVWAFGSRVDGTARKYSDLDLVFIGSTKMSNVDYSILKEKFEESMLNFRVDIVDWHTCTDKFKNIIPKKYVILKGQDNLI